MDDKLVNQLTDILHKKLCTANHTDGCEWFYTEGTPNHKESWSYLKYNNIAKKILSKTEYDVAVHVIECL